MIFQFKADSMMSKTLPSKTGVLRQPQIFMRGPPRPPASRAARRGVHGRARLEAAHGDDLLLLPDLEGEGTGSLAKDSVGAVVEGVERGNQTQTRRALRRSARSLLGSWRLELCLGKEKAGASKDLREFFKLCQLGLHLLSKIHLAKQLEH
jgi:hypothetical protein